MSRIRYRVGNMFPQLPTESTIVAIPHIVNDLGAWGAGFVVPLAKNYPKSREAYVDWHKGEQVYPKFELGSMQPVKVAENVFVCNMIAQSGLKSLDNPKPIKYLALAKCLERVNNLCGPLGVEVHAPAFGSDLAGGDWRVISALIDEILTFPANIYIYTLTQEQQDRLLERPVLNSPVGDFR
jgi:hypothetical protein